MFPSSLASSDSKLPFFFLSRPARFWSKNLETEHHERERIFDDRIKVKKTEREPIDDRDDDDAE